MIDREMARRSASKRFGEVFFWWYAAPVVIGHVLKAVAVVAATAGLLWSGLYVFEHAGQWVAWLGWLFSTYLLPSVLVSVGVTLYAILSVVVWRVFGWRWSFNGFSTGAYTLSVVGLLVFIIVGIGVGVSL